LGLFIEDFLLDLFGEFEEVAPATFLSSAIFLARMVGISHVVLALFVLFSLLFLLFLSALLFLHLQVDRDLALAQIFRI
jgi:hypothetical protein